MAAGSFSAPEGAAGGAPDPGPRPVATAVAGDAASKPASAAQREPPQPVDAKPIEVGAPAPTKYEFTYPEGVRAEDMNSERMAAYTGILGEAQVPVEAGQKLIDLHLTEL